MKLQIASEWGLNDLFERFDPFNRAGDVNAQIYAMRFGFGHETAFMSK